MSDEHNPKISSVYGHPFVKTPNMQKLADEGVVVEDFYCNSPLCVPSRMSFITGRYANEVDVYDNQSPLSSAQPTLAHLLNNGGYETVLSGKHHFIGPDQRHGYKKILVEDIEGGGGCRPNFSWKDVDEYATGSRLRITKAGRPVTKDTLPIRFDKKVFKESVKYLREYAKSSQDKPFFLNVGFLAPHFPLICAQKYWDLYWPKLADLPEIQEPPAHPMYKRLKHWFDLKDNIPEIQLRKCRAAYYGLTTFLDDHIGGLCDILSETGLDRSTVVIYTSDHGEMLGERGLWWKCCFLDSSARVPFIIRFPECYNKGKRIDKVASLVDLTVTILAIAGIDVPDYMVGDNMLNLLMGNNTGWKDQAFCEYLAHGTDRPLCSLRKGRYKLNYSPKEPFELYDMKTDPNELNNLAEENNYDDIIQNMFSEINKSWNWEEINNKILLSQHIRSHLPATSMPMEDYMKSLYSSL